MTKEELKQWDEWWQETNEYGKTFEESQEEIRKEIDEIIRKDKTGDGAPRTSETDAWNRKDTENLIYDMWLTYTENGGKENGMYYKIY